MARAEPGWWLLYPPGSRYHPEKYMAPLRAAHGAKFQQWPRSRTAAIARRDNRIRARTVRRRSRDRRSTAAARASVKTSRGPTPGPRLSAPPATIALPESDRPDCREPAMPLPRTHSPPLRRPHDRCRHKRPRVFPCMRVDVRLMPLPRRLYKAAELGSVSRLTRSSASSRLPVSRSRSPGGWAGSASADSSPWWMSASTAKNRWSRPA